MFWSRDNLKLSPLAHWIVLSSSVSPPLRSGRLSKMARTIDSRPYEFSFSSFVTGYHVYKEDWTPVIGEKVKFKREPENLHDPHAVAACKHGEIVGHIPRIISKPCFYALLGGAQIEATVTGARQNTRQKGLEIPVKYLVKGPHERMIKAQTYIRALIE